MSRCTTKSIGLRRLNLEALEQRHLLAQVVGAPLDFVGDTTRASQPTSDVESSGDLATMYSPADSLPRAETSIALPQGIPKRFAADVAIAGETWTLDFEKHSAFGENTRFLVDDGSGALIEMDRGVDRSYLGTVAERPTYTVSALLTDAGLMAYIFRPGQSALKVFPSPSGLRTAAGVLHLVGEDEAAGSIDHDHDGDGIQDHAPEDHPDDSSGGHPPGCQCGACCPTSVRSNGGVPRSFGGGVYEYEVGVEVGSNALNNNYNGATIQEKVDHAMLEVQMIPGNMDGTYLHATGIRHRLGTVIIRTTSDPFTVSHGNDGAGLAAFRDYWNDLQNNEGIAPTHDLAVYHVRSAPSGLAYVNSVGTSNRYALSASNGPSSWAAGTLIHEFGHSWSLAHVNSSTFYESKPRNFSGSHMAGGEDVFISVMHGGGDHNIGRLATDEANKVLGVKANKLQFGDLITNPGPIRPFGHRDLAFAGENPIVIDVVANDLDSNNDVLDVQLLDTVSQKGASISLSVGTGPGGRSEIIYTPPVNPTGEVDFFHYTVVDSTGRTDWGAVYVESTAVSVNLAQDDFPYDFGTIDSPVFSNATVQAVRISPETTGDVEWSDPVQALDYPSSGQNNYNRDLVFGTQPVTWSHPVQDGRWNVVVNMSDPGFNLDNMYVDAEGQPGLTDLDRPIGQNQTVSFEVDVTDGELNLTFGDADTVNPRWALNRVVLEQITEYLPPLLPGDYNGDELVDAADFTVWRDALGQSVQIPYEGADGDGDLVIDMDDYDIWVANFNKTLISTPLIDATLGNGEFNVDDANDVSVFGGGSSQAQIDLSRDRALRQEGVPGRGISVLGWDIERVELNGGNPAFGTDGTYGFAPNPGTGPGQTGQAFVNSGSVLVRSDPITHSFALGDQVDLSYLLGSDTGAGSTVAATVSLIFDEGLATEQSYDLDMRNAVDLTTPAINEQIRLVSPASTVSVEFLLDGGTSVRTLLDQVELSKVEPGSILPPVAGTPLLDATMGNGSFEDQTGATGTTVNPPLVMARDETATIPGWTAQTVLVGGWNGGVAGAATDGSIYAFAASEAELTLTSDPVAGHVTAAGNQFRLSFDAGSNNGTLNYYEARLIFGGNTRVVGSVFEGANVTTTGAVRHEFSYTATGADAGELPVVQLFVDNNGNFSQAYLDTVELEVVGAPGTLRSNIPSLPQFSFRDVTPYTSPPASQRDLLVESGAAQYVQPDQKLVDRALASWGITTTERFNRSHDDGLGRLAPSESDSETCELVERQEW